MTNFNFLFCFIFLSLNSMQDSWMSILTIQQVWNWRIIVDLPFLKKILKIINPLSVTNTQHPPLSYLSAWASWQRLYKEKQGRIGRNSAPMTVTAKMTGDTHGSILQEENDPIFHSLEPLFPQLQTIQVSKRLRACVGCRFASWRKTSWSLITPHSAIPSSTVVSNCLLKENSLD